MNEMILKAYREGKLVHKAEADKSHKNLLTNPETKHSVNAVSILN